MRKTYRQNKETGKFEEVERAKVGSRLTPVSDEITAFISPVDGSLISTKKELLSHNRRNGVTNDIDSLREKTDRTRARQQAPLNKRERVNDLIESYDRVSQNSRR